jgi:hypothetical protein
MSDLRDRIASAVYKHLEGTQFRTIRDSTPSGLMPDEQQRIAVIAADAVIAELGLEEELTYGGTVRRYVTDWKAATTPPGYWYDKDGTKADDETD